MNSELAFNLHPGAPTSIRVASEAPEDLSHAVELCFPMETVDAVLLWHGHQIRIGYKYDVSVILEPLVDMLEACLESSPEHTFFGSDTLTADFRLSYRDEEVVISANWESTLGPPLSVLNQEPTVIIKKTRFLECWARLLSVTANAVRESNIASYVREDLASLDNLLNRIAARNTKTSSDRNFGR